MIPQRADFATGVSARPGTKHTIRFSGCAENAVRARILYTEDASDTSLTSFSSAIFTMCFAAPFLTSGSVS